MSKILIDEATVKLALEAFSVIAISDNLDWIRHQAEQQAAALREALAEQPAPVQGWKLVPVDPTPEQIKEGNKVTWPLPCAQAYSTMLAAAPQPAQHPAYEQANPLGGPAKVFQAMADAIRAGDSYHAVLRQYGYAEQPAQQQEPVVRCMEHGECFGGECIYTSPPAQRKPPTEAVFSFWRST